MGKGNEKKSTSEQDKRTKLRKTREKTKVWMRHAGLGICNVPWLQNLSLPEAPG